MAYALVKQIAVLVFSPHQATVGQLAFCALIIQEYNNEMPCTGIEPVTL